MKRILIAMLGLATIMPTLAHAQTIPMTLEECLNYAEKNQTKIKNAILDQRITDSRVKEIYGLALPHLNAKGNMSYAPLVAAFEVPNFIKSAIAGDPESNMSGLVKDEAINQDVKNNTPNTIPLAFQPKWNTSGSLEANQILFDPSVMVAFQARQALKELASKNIELTIQDVKVGVAKSYYNILIAEKQQALIVQNIARMTQMENETREIYKTGFAEKLDVDRITVILNNLQTQKLRIEQMIQLANLTLKFQMGMPLEQSISLTDSLSPEHLLMNLLQEQFDLRSRKEYQLMQVQGKLLAFDINKYKLGWLPSLSLFANSGYTLFNTQKLFDSRDQWQRSALIGANITVPVFDGFQRRQKLKQAEWTLQKIENDLANLKLALNLENENAKTVFKNNLIALDNQKRNMKLAEDVYTTARIKYKEGVGSSLEIINAESALKEAQTNYFIALYEVMTSRIDLLKTLGQF